MKPYTFHIALAALALALATADDTTRRPFKLDLKQPGGFTTAVGFERDGPPPWQDGNCLAIGKWAVLNMHTENLQAFRAKFRVDELEVLPVSDTAALVTDARVGREWLKTGLCEHCIPLPRRLVIRSRHKQYFQAFPGEEKLVDSVWELADRQDMGLPKVAGRALPNIIAAILPGERLRFKNSTVACSTVAGEPAGERSWELTREGAQVMLTIYQLKDKTGHYDAIRFRVVKLDQELDLVPDGWMTWTTESKSWLALQREPVKSQVSYRRFTEPQKPR